MSIYYSHGHDVECAVIKKLTGDKYKIAFGDEGETLIVTRRDIKFTLTAGDKLTIRSIMGRVHVGTPDDEVKAMIRERLEGRDTTVPQLVTLAVNYALKCHHKNLADYRFVMGGH